MLSTYSYLEYYLTLLAWVINNGLWYAMAETSLAAWPFLAIIIQEWLRARGEGADEGNKGILSIYRVENRVYVGFLVVLFACVPIVNLTIAQMKFDKEASLRCGVTTPDPSATGWGAGFETSIGGKTAQIPLWWALMHTISKGVTAATVAAIPCSPDIRQIMIVLDEARINDKVLLQEVADFSHECYGAARYRFNNNMPNIDKSVDYDVGWIGSSYFLNTAGYYNTLRSHKPRVDFPYNSTRDAGLANVAGGGGYPTCKEWWEAGSKGLRAKLLTNISPSLMTSLQGWLTGRTHAEIADAAVRRLVSPEQQARTMRPGEVYQEYGYSSRNESGNEFNNIATNVGLGFGYIKYMPTLNALKTALPMVQAFLLMAVVICIPLLLPISTYDLKVLMTITFGLFALHFCTFWWELARWIDSSMLNALYGDVGAGYKFALSLPTAFANDASVTHMVMLFVIGALFLLLPMIFFSVMAWAGFNVGAGIGTMMQNSTKGAATAGGEAAGKGVDNVKSKLGI
ncbi:MAG: conjugal transfer protein TraG N-terminal domain-containing protein [Burkholderiales bacterium]|jgi:hypothetical protein|nr:conjugal transfer protein TraG N-terminal domain-containing protein [Burkholderiales bacterium]